MDQLRKLLERELFPAHAGVILIQSGCAAPNGSVPRTRGGDPPI